MASFPFFRWKEGKNIIWDFTCSDSLAWSHINATALEAGKAAEQAERKKLAKYDYLTSNYIFVPIAVETMGSWGKLGLKFIKDLGSRIAERTGDKRATGFLFQSLGMSVQRGNAACVIGTVPPHKKLDELLRTSVIPLTYFITLLLLRPRLIKERINLLHVVLLMAKIHVLE